MPGAAQLPSLFPVIAWGLLMLCPQGSPTSVGHPLPSPLQDPRLSPHPLGSHTPMIGEDQSPPGASVDYDTYEDYYDTLETTKPPTSGSPRMPPATCDYDRCRHLQVPCLELSQVTKCLCPGVTGPEVAPASPRLRTVHVSESRVSLHWCAPSSTVQEYHFQYRPIGGDFVSGAPLNSSSRLAVISGLWPSTEYLFCVVASNQAGSSPTDDGLREHGPCRHVRTPLAQMTYVYISVGLASALILLAISVLLWHSRTRRAEPVPHGSLDNILEAEAGLGKTGTSNRSFRSEEHM